MHLQAQMWRDYLNIPYHIPNKSSNRKQQSCFPSWDQCTDDGGEGYTDDKGNDLEQKKINIHPLPSVSRNMNKDKSFQNRNHDLEL